MEFGGVTTPLLSAVALSGVTLDPTFDSEVYAYTGASTTDACTLTATAVSGVTLSATIDGVAQAIGEAFTWGATGDYDVVVKASINGTTNFVLYEITVSVDLD